MIALCVDDEILLLNALKRAVEQSPDISEVVAFDDEIDAIEWAGHNHFDVAFLDVQLHEMNGLELAVRLHKIAPQVPVIFCTGYSDYALDAFRVHASGYLLKPITKEKVQEEIDNLKRAAMPKSLLTVKCHGRFEAKDRNGNILDFRRSLAKEFLALLVHRRGESIGSREICMLLFKSGPEIDTKDRNHFYKVVRELNRALHEADADRVLLKSGGVYCLDMELIAFADAGKGSEPYMAEYYWAQE